MCLPTKRRGRRNAQKEPKKATKDKDYLSLGIGGEGGKPKKRGSYLHNISIAERGRVGKNHSHMGGRVAERKPRTTQSSNFFMGKNILNQGEKKRQCSTQRRQEAKVKEL